jgi:hypothetical protein
MYRHEIRFARSNAGFLACRRSVHKATDCSVQMFRDPLGHISFFPKRSIQGRQRRSVARELRKGQQGRVARDLVVLESELAKVFFTTSSDAVL